MHPSWRICLLGDVRIERDRVPFHPALSPRALSLLAYFLLHRHPSPPRAVLIGQFWPDLPEPRARHALSHLVWRLRRALPQLIQADSNSIVIPLDAPVQVDAVEFRSLTAPHLKTTLQTTDVAQARADLRRAIDLYRGDLLEGSYDDWILLERERLRETYLQALERLAEMVKSRGDYAQALDLALTLARADPLREQAHREVMRLFFLLNRPADALGQFEVCRSVLADELKAEPEPQTIALAQEIAHRSGTMVAHLPDVALFPAPIFLDRARTIPLVGRGRERSELLTYLEGIYSGAGSVVLVEGEAGVGKTRLLQEIARDAEWRGAVVLHGRAQEQARPAFGLLTDALAGALSPLRVEQIARLVDPIWLQVLRPRLGALAARLPASVPLAALEPAQERARLAEAIVGFLAAWAQITPLVLILEDLHWASPDTLDVLPYLARQTERMSALVVGSYRGEEARAQPTIWDKLQALDRSNARGRLVLSRLDLDATGELIRWGLGLGKPAPLFEARLFSETGGNPLFVLETLRALYEEGLLQRSERGEWSTSFDETTHAYEELPLPPEMERVIARRVKMLPDDLHAMLNAAAVLGAHLDFGLLCAVGTRPAPMMMAALRALVRRGLLVETPQEYHYSHEKIRQVVYAGIAEEERVELHGRAARAMAQVHPEWTAEIAHHLTEGRVWERAVQYHRQAATEAVQNHAYASAAEHLAAALALAGRASLEPAARFDLLAAHEGALNVLGNREAQSVDLAQMDELARHLGEPFRLISVYQRRSWLASNTGSFSEAEAAARQALALARQVGDVAAQAAALTALGTALQARGDDREAVPHLQEAIALYQKAADRQGESSAHTKLAIIFADASEYDRARPEVEAALALAQARNDQPGYAYGLALLGWILNDQAMTDEAEIPLQRALEMSRALGYRQGEIATMTTLTEVFRNRGQIDQALALYEQAIKICESVDERKAQAFFRSSLPLPYLSTVGDYETARHKAEEALAFSRRMGFQYHVNTCEGMLGVLALRQGDLQAARSYLESAAAGLLASPYRREQIMALRWLVELELAADRPESALQHLEKSESICRDGKLNGIAVNLLADRGTVLLALGQPEAALAATTQAMAGINSSIEGGYVVPFAHYRALSALGQTEKARLALEQAHEMLSRVMATLSSEQQKMSWECVPEHRAILAAWRAKQPERATVRLPRIGVPTGRPLRDDEYVQVSWTIATPADTAVDHKTARRQRRLLRLLREAREQGAAPRVDDLAEALGASRATIKRDLAALRQANVNVRTRGHRTKK